MSSWRDEEPSLSQLALLDKWGIKPDGLTKGEVSDIITQELNERRGQDWEDDFEAEDFD